MTLDPDRLLGRAGLWPARLVWLAAPVVAGPGLGLLLEEGRETAALLVEIGLWAAWFVILLATLVPSPPSLTACRIAAPVGLGIGVIAVATNRGEVAALGTVVWMLLAIALVFLPLFADRMINGSAYGSERRMALRPPGYVLVGPIQVAWLAVFGGLVIPSALVLRERYLLALATGIIGAGAVWAGSRILHQLARRWVVFVPAGFVIRDPMTLVDAVLFRRNTVTALGPALAEGTPSATADHTERTERTDLSGGARGLALEVVLRDPTPIGLRVRNEARNLEVTNIVFTPSLPGAMLSEARIRGLKIGTPTG